MAFDREAAKQAGYTDDEINAYLQAEAKKAKAPTPVTTDVGEPPPPTTTITPVETSAGSIATQTGMAVAPYVVPAAGAAAAALGGKALYNRWDASAKAAQSLADAKLASEQGIAQRFEQRMAQQAGQNAAQAARPVAPQILDAAGRPMAPTTPTAPVAPSGPAPMAPQEANLLSRASQIVKQLALDKVAKAGVGLGLATYSPELGPKVPSVGRMRGMEINPLTGAPWTPEQIKQYESNPNMFDAQLAPPQMRR